MSIDVGIVIQSRMFQEQTEKDEEEERKKREVEEAEEARRRPTTDEEEDVPMQSTKSSTAGGRRQETNEWDEDLDQEDAVLFDSMSLGPPKGKGGAAGDLGRGGQMFTIEADDE